MPVAGALIAGVGTVASAIIGSNAAKKAARAQEKATQQASEIQTKALETMRADLEPFRTSGAGAMKNLAELYGLPTVDNPQGGVPMSGNAIGAWERAPDYKVGFDAGVKALNNNDAARGMLLSGEHYKRLNEFGQDYANTRFNQYVSRLYQLAGMGSNAAARTGQATMTTADNVAQNTVAGANAKASGIVGGANQWTKAIGGLSDNAAYLASRFGSSYSEPDSLY